MKFGFFSTKTGPRLAQSVTPVRPRLRAAFICTGNPESAGTWSGTPLHMLTHLRPLFAATLDRIVFTFRVPELRRAAPDTMPRFRVFRRDAYGHVDVLQATPPFDRIGGSWEEAWFAMSLLDVIRNQVERECRAAASFLQNSITPLACTRASPARVCPASCSGQPTSSDRLA